MAIIWLLLMVWGLLLLKIAWTDAKTRKIDYPLAVYLLAVSSLSLIILPPYHVQMSILLAGLTLVVSHKLGFPINDKLLLLSVSFLPSPINLYTVLVITVSLGGYTLLLRSRNVNLPFAPLVLLASLAMIAYNIERLINYGG